VPPHRNCRGISRILDQTGTFQTGILTSLNRSARHGDTDARPERGIAGAVQHAGPRKPSDFARTDPPGPPRRLLRHCRRPDFQGHYAVAHARKRRDRIGRRVERLGRQGVGQPLMMNSGRIDGFLKAQP